MKKEHNVIVTNFNIYLLDKRGLASRWASEIQPEIDKRQNNSLLLERSLKERRYVFIKLRQKQWS